MTCGGKCGRDDLPPYPGQYCRGCGRVSTQLDVDWWQRNMIAPHKDIEEARENFALRQGDD